MNSFRISAALVELLELLELSLDDELSPPLGGGPPAPPDPPVPPPTV